MCFLRCKGGVGNMQVSLPQLKIPVICVYILKWSNYVNDLCQLCVYSFYTLDFIQPQPMQIWFFCTMPVIQYKAYEAGLEVYVLSLLVLGLLLKVWLGNQFWSGKSTNQVYVLFLIPNQMRCLRTASWLDLHR